MCSYSLFVEVYSGTGLQTSPEIRLFGVDLGLDFLGYFTAAAVKESHQYREAESPEKV